MKLKARTHLLLLLPAIALTALGSAARASEAAAPTVAEVGRPAPNFTLKDTDGKEHQLSNYIAQGKVVVLEWFNPDCPFVKRHHAQSKTMVDLSAAYKDKGVVWLAINSGAPGNQGAGLERNAKAKKEYDMDYPILLDESGVTGRMYGAKTTPHMFVIGKDGILLYAGAIDDDPRGTKADRVNYVERALASCVTGQPVAKNHSDSYGCSVKYKATAAM
jgi:peroxiredoxin